MADDGTPTWRKYWGWSNTKQHQWETCRKQYWFANVRRYAFDYGSTEAEELRFLARDLTSLGMLTGAMVHDAIEAQIGHHQLTRQVSLDGARAHVRRRLGEVRQAPEKHLVEAVNGLGVDADDLDACAERADALLSRFFEEVWPRVRDRRYLAHEELDDLTVDGVRVIVVADLVTELDDGTVCVTDWKTGSRQGDPDDHLQLGTYLLWASRRYDVEPADLRGELVYLQDGAFEITEPTRERLEDVRQTIVEQGSEMLQADSFPADPGDDVCPTCPFATICEEGEEHLPEGTRNPYR